MSHIKQLAIIGHKERSNEVINILRKLGGQDQPVPCDGASPNTAYYIKDGYIVCSLIRELDKVYVTLEYLDVLYNAIKSTKEEQP